MYIPGAGNGARSSNGISNGKKYFEVYCGLLANVGFCDNKMNLCSTGWPNNLSFVVQGGTCNFYIGTRLYPYNNKNPIVNSSNNLVCFAIDMDDKLLNIYINNEHCMKDFNLNNKIDSVMYPFVYHGGGSGAYSLKWNFGSEKFIYDMPSGYTCYDDEYSVSCKYFINNLSLYKSNFGIINILEIQENYSADIINDNEEILISNYNVLYSLLELNSNIYIGLKNTDNKYIRKIKIPFRSEKPYRTVSNRTFNRIEYGYKNKNINQNNNIKTIM